MVNQHVGAARKFRTTLVLALVAALSITAFAATQALGKSKPSFQTKGTQDGLKIQGKVTKSSFGKGTYKGLIINDGSGSDLTLKFKKGTIRIVTKAKINGRNLVGTWKITKSTGKLKGTKGKGPLSGDLSTGVVKFKAG